MKNWLKAQPNQPTTITDLQTLLDAFTQIYNHHRPHRSLQRRTPATVYVLLPKDTPNNEPNPHHRIRYDRIDETGAVSLRRAGRMHHIGIGRAHKYQPVVLIIEEVDIRVINTKTGEQLRHLTLNPNHGYQPRFKNQRNP